MATRGQDRTRLVPGDPDRSLATVWAVGGGFDPTTYRWVGPFGVVSEVPRVHLPRTSGNGWPLQFYGSVSLLANAVPGRWLLDSGRGPEFAFDVVAPTPRKHTTTLAPGASAAAITKALAVGDVVLTGLYDIGAATIDPPQEPRTIFGAGAVILSSSRSWVVSSSPDLTISGFGPGITFEAPLAKDGVFAWNPGLVCKRCVFHDCNLGAVNATVTLINCLFDGAGATNAPRGLMWKCRFRGPGWPHAYQLRYSPGADGSSACQIDCEYDDTDRGPVFNTDDGPITDCLFVGTRLRNIAGTENGSESFISEGAHEFSRNLVFTTRAHGCRGSCVQFQSPARDNRVWDMQTDAPTLFWGDNTGNVFSDCEWRDAPVEFGPLAANNRIENSGLSVLSPHRWNQNGFALDMYDQPIRRVAVRATDMAGNLIDTPQSRSNVLAGCRLYVGDAVLPTTVGVGRVGCKVDGQPVPDVIASDLDAGTSVP